jgi:hypothetical protein
VRNGSLRQFLSAAAGSHSTVIKLSCRQSWSEEHVFIAHMPDNIHRKY